MVRQKVLLGSVLKPVDDIRMSQKIGLSLARQLDLEVHIAGFYTQHPVNLPELRLHPLFRFPRLSWKRLLAPWRFFRLAQQLRPGLLLISTHELLLPACLYYAIYKVPVVYDVRENYRLNILHTAAFPRLLRKPLAWLVRQVEKLTAGSIAHFLLAERSYAAQLPFVSGKYTVLENKFLAQPGRVAALRNSVPLAQAPDICLLYSGTIAESYGIFEAVKLAKALHQLDPRYHLLIIGYAAQAGVLQQLQNVITGKDFVRLIGGKTHVPHSEIVQAIQQAQVGLLPYHPRSQHRSVYPDKAF